MGIRHYTPFLLSLMVYSILNFFWGNSGVYATREVQEIRQDLQENIQDLKRINIDLRDELGELQRDVTVYSGDIGYIRDSEALLFLHDAPEAVQKWEVGNLVSIEPKFEGPGTLFKWLSTVAFLSVVLLSLTVGRRRRRG